MDSSSIIGWMIVACLLFISLIIFSKPVKLLFKVCINSLIGISALFITNYLLAPLGISVGINVFTALIIGLLGIPGFICVYVLHFVV